MSHSSGISISDEALNAFSSARENKSAIRFVEIRLEGENFLLDHTARSVKDQQGDWSQLEARLKPKEPRIFLYRLDDMGICNFWFYT